MAGISKTQVLRKCTHRPADDRNHFATGQAGHKSPSAFDKFLLNPSIAAFPRGLDKAAVAALLWKASEDTR